MHVCREVILAWSQYIGFPDQKDSENYVPQSTVRRVFFQTLCYAIVTISAEMAGYIAVAGLNLLAQISDRISPDSV